MKFFLISLTLLLIELSANKINNNVNFKIKTVNIKEAKQFLITADNRVDTASLFFDGNDYLCKAFNENYYYCMNSDKKLLFKRYKHKNINRNILLEVYDYKTGKILKEGYITNNWRDMLIGKWKIYDYKKKKIKYIHFNQRPKISELSIVKWAKKQDPNWYKFLKYYVTNNKKIWQVTFTSMEVFIDADNGKILKYKLHFNPIVDSEKDFAKKKMKKYRCVNKEFKKNTKIYKITKKCKLWEYAITE